MTNEAKVDVKIDELVEAVKEAKGNIMVIGLIGTDKKDENCLMSRVSGSTVKLIEAVAHLLINHNGTPMSSIIKKGFAFANLYKVMDAGSTDVTEKETLESNNQ